MFMRKNVSSRNTGTSGGPGTIWLHHGFWSAGTEGEQRTGSNHEEKRKRLRTQDHNDIAGTPWRTLT